MEQLKKKGTKIQTQTTEELSEAYSQMVKLHQGYLYRKIIDTIHYHIRGMREAEIESLIDRYFLIDLKYRGKQTISKLEEDLQTDFIQTLDTVKDGDKEKLQKVYLEKINASLRRNKIDWLPEITNQFSKQLMQKIDLYFASFRDIPNTNLNITLENLEKEITKIMKQYQSKFEEDYQTLLNNFLKHNKKQISELMNQITLSNQKSSNFQIYSAIMDLSNYELIEENGVIYAKDRTSAKKVELSFNGDILSSKDNKLRYYIDQKRQRIGYFNNETKVAILVHDGLITLIPPKKEAEEKKTISFVKKGHNYQFYHNLKPTNNLEEVKTMVQEIEKYAPSIYNKLISDLDFGKLLVQLKYLDSTKSSNDEKTKDSELLTEIKPTGRKPK